MKNQACFYIDGRWVAPHGNQSCPVIAAATEEILGTIPLGNAEDANAAVHAARRALRSWNLLPPMVRGAYLSRLASHLAARSEEIACLISREVGMPIRLSRRIQVGQPISLFNYYARLAETFSFESSVGNSRVFHEAVGVVACITPWNYPLHQIVAKVAPALAAGCTVIVKPSEIAPLSAFMLAEAVSTVGLPPGVFNLLTGEGATIGEALVTHPQVDMISFTGSTVVGRKIGCLAAGSIKRLGLELGGKSAAIVLGTADLALAVNSTVGSCFLNSGQTCTAHTRLIVPQSLYAEAAELATEAARRFIPGDPLKEETRLGPLASASQRDKVIDCITVGLHEGAELLCGGIEPPPGLRKGFYVTPTVLGHVMPGSTIDQEEIFGPVLAILTYPDGDIGKALEIANGTIYGLAGAVWAGGDEEAMAVARFLQAGQIDINGGPYNLLAPFGGFKQSGSGRELGVWGLEKFLELKSVQLPWAATQAGKPPLPAS